MKRKSTLIIEKMARDFGKAHYESGVQLKSLKNVWRNIVYPKMGICYKTFLKYMKTKDNFEKK